MSWLSFFDTNIVVYADDEAFPQKRQMALNLITQHLRTGTAVVSIQVLQEYFVTATKKLKIAPEAAQRKVNLLARCKVVRLGTHDIDSAIDLHRLDRISFWDALIVHAARSAGAGILYSEDLQPGSTIAGVKIVNPFAGAAN